MYQMPKSGGYCRHKINKPICILFVAGAREITLENEYRRENRDSSLWEMIYVERGTAAIQTAEQNLQLEPNTFYLHRGGKFLLRRATDGEQPAVTMLTFSSPSQSLQMFEDCKTFVSVHNRKYLATLLRECEMTFADPALQKNTELPVVRPDALLGGEQTIINRLEIFFVELMREEQRRSTSSIISKETITNKTVLRIIDMLESRLYEKITLDEISDSISYSKSYLSRLFRSVCGYSIMEYYIMIKIEEAKRLIQETDSNFSQISERLRFDNPHYFSIVFKRITGMTPSDYAKIVRRS